MRYYILAAALLLSSCKKEQTEIATTDSTTIAVDRDTIANSPSTSILRDTIIEKPAADTIVNSGSTAVKEKGKQLMPVDEASKDASFAAFRTQLLAAVESKSESDLISMLDPNIRVSFGGSGGLSDFRKNWKPQDKNSQIWPKLEWVLKHGGSFRNEGANKMFWAPYVYSNWPESGPDAFEYGAIVGSDVPVFEKPDASSPQFTSLDHHFVKVLDGGHLREKTPAFVKIQTPSGKTGYVRSSEIRSQLDYRAGFDKRSGKWKMTTFIAGD